jgi:hypothetical protein
MVADISLQYVQLANGERIGYRERAGGTRPLVLVHGNMTSSVQRSGNGFRGRSSG